MEYINMLQFDKPKYEWDDLDLYDREAAEIRRALDKIDLRQWVKDCHSLEPELYSRLRKYIHEVDTGKL